MEPGPDGGAALFLRAVRQWRFVAGLALDGVGFLLHVAALRSIPIYAVGAALLGVRLSRAEWTAVGVVCVGLGIASGAAGDLGGPAALKYALLGVAVAVLLLGPAAGRLPERGRAAVLGLGAGLGFGVVEGAVRLIDSPDPAAYALLVGGAAAFLALTSALQRGSVTAATAAMVIGETIDPATVGVGLARRPHGRRPGPAGGDRLHSRRGGRPGPGPLRGGAGGRRR